MNGATSLQKRDPSNGSVTWTASAITGSWSSIAFGSNFVIVADAGEDRAVHVLLRPHAGEAVLSGGRGLEAGQRGVPALQGMILQQPT